MQIVWFVAMLVSGYLAYTSMHEPGMNENANIFGVLAAIVAAICFVKLLESLTPSRKRSS